MSPLTNLTMSGIGSPYYDFYDLMEDDPLSAIFLGLCSLAVELMIVLLIVCIVLYIAGSKRAMKRTLIVCAILLAVAIILFACLVFRIANLA